MRIVIPQPPQHPNTAERALRTEGLDPCVVPMTDDLAYARLLTEEWARGGFILVEADVVPWPGALEVLWECPEPWCAFQYPHRTDAPHWPTGSVLAASLGCVKFSDELVQAHPHVPREWEGKHWESLDGFVMGAVWSALGYERWHIHRPAVAHARMRTT